MLRWGIIGCGDIAVKRVIPALLAEPRSELTALSRRNTDALGDCADRFGVQQRFADWQELVRSDSVDAVYIATPVHLHAEQTIKALQAGKHVLCEKPMAYDSQEARNMIDAARKADRRLGIAYYRRFYPMVARISELIRNGEIGKPLYIRASNCEAINPGPGEPRRWLLEPKLSGGGPLMDMGCHRLDLFVHLFGAPVSDPQFRLSYGRLKNRDVEDSAWVNLEFKNNVVGELFCSHAPAESMDSLEIIGDQGTIRIPVLNGSQLSLIRKASGEIQELREEIKTADNVHYPLIKDFVTAVEAGADPFIDGEHALPVTEILDYVYGR